MRSRDALNALYDGPDGIKGTPDDTDAILALGNNFAGAPAKAGFPSVTVPGGFIVAGPGDPPIAVPFPRGHVLGAGVLGATLIALAFAFEQATQYRVPPASTPALPSDVVHSRHGGR